MTPAEACEYHGLQWLSASTCNTFAMSPAAFVVEKLLKRPLGAGLPAIRGRAAEIGVAHGLRVPGASDAACAEAAFDLYDSEVARTFAPDKERIAIPGIVKKALAELRQYGNDVKTQMKIEYKDDSLPIPFIGYVDFFWPGHNILVDLKSQLRLSPAIKPGHARQVALYAAGGRGNADARVCYATPKECAVYGLEDPGAHLKALVRIGHALLRFLAMSRDPQELAAITVPDLDHFLWGTAQARKVAWDTWGI